MLDSMTVIISTMNKWLYKHVHEDSSSVSFQLKKVSVSVHTCVCHTNYMNLCLYFYVYVVLNVLLCFITGFDVASSYTTACNVLISMDTC